MEIKAAQKALALELTIEPEMDRIYQGDPHRIRQVLINLIGNAIKFTDKGSISVCVAPIENDRDTLHFKVKDTGAGIPADRLNSIFESFTQADGSITRRYGGTGLGVTISRQLVALMGGRIWVESELGCGSIFQFTLPLRPTAATGEELHEFLYDRGLPSSPRLFHILLAEDIEENITLALHRLEKQGHLVTVARNGREAVNAFQQGGIDMVLMDIQMPEMDGLEATRMIRELEKNSSTHIPVIALTASVMKEDRNKCIDAGMDAIVGKPIDFGQLFAVMEKFAPEGVGRMRIENAGAAVPVTTFDFPAVDGVDVEKGMTTWEDKALYAKALSGFAEDYGNAAEIIAESIRANDFDAAYSHAHTLKGVSGNLSITGVYAIAEELHLLLHNKQIEKAGKLTGPLGEALEKVTTAINRFAMQQDAGSRNRKEMDDQQVAALFRNLLSVFKKHNPYAAEPFLTELTAFLSEAEIEPIRIKIDQFDFPAAEQETIKLAANLGINPGASYDPS